MTSRFTSRPSDPITPLHSSDSDSLYACNETDYAQITSQLLRETAAAYAVGKWATWPKDLARRRLPRPTLPSLSRSGTRCAALHITMYALRTFISRICRCFKYLCHRIFLQRTRACRMPSSFGWPTCRQQSRGQALGALLLLYVDMTQLPTNLTLRARFDHASGVWCGPLSLSCTRCCEIRFPHAAGM